MPQKGHLDFTGQQEILTEIGREILGSVPDTWTEIVYSVYAIVSYREEEMLVRHGDGTPERTSIPAGVAPRISGLRAGMYQEDKGAWFSMRYTITRPGKFTTEFDYDNEPEFLFRPSDDNYVQELRHFPRSEENVPEWLAEKVRGAGGDSA